MTNEIKLPPNDSDAEESVIGSLLIDGDAISEIQDIVSVDDFYFDRNRLMYQAAVALKERRESINQITMARELDRMGKLAEVGGAARMSYLISVCPTSLDIEHYAKIVRRLSISRSMISLGDKIMAAGYRDHPDTNKAIDDIYTMITNFRKSHLVSDGIVTPHTAADMVYDLMEEYQEKKNPIRYGFRDLDKITGGIFSELIVIGARPSVGKTQIMLDIMENIAVQGRTILFCSAEMVVKSLFERKVARELKTDILRLREGLSDDMRTRIAEIAGEVSEQQVYYMPPGVSSSDIFNEARKLKDSIGLNIVFVDYLQILKDCWDGGARENQVVRVGRACKTLKSIVNELGIPVIVASQLNRASEYRSGENRFPVLADLRESGDIEQDADVVFLLHRDKETDDNFKEDCNSKVLRVQMAKNRQLGWAKAQELLWLDEQRRYADIYHAATY